METPDGESTESVVLQCMSSEEGEEVVTRERLFFPTSTVEEKTLLLASKRRGDCEDDDEDVGVLVSANHVRAWLSNFANDTAYWNSGVRVRTRRCKAPKSYVEDVVERTPAKRKHEEIDECGPVSESGLDEGTSDDASSSDSDASEYSEYAHNYNNSKRRRADQLQFRTASEPANCDNELKEMQLLLELQLKASERREAGMKQRMETMMDLMSRHMGHVEKRVCTLDLGSQPQERILERINTKLEQVMEGFTALNENLSILSACLSRDLDSQ